MKKCIILVFVIIVLCGCSKIKEEITPGKINCNQKSIVMGYNNAILIDVRSTIEYNEEHLDGAINIPYDSILDDIKVIDNVSFDSPIIVYCKSGTRSAKAASSLKTAGYNKVYDLGAMSSCK